jgi:hypothetical protein
VQELSTARAAKPARAATALALALRSYAGGPASTPGSTIITVAVAGTLPLQREMLRREVHLLPLRRGVHWPRTLLQLPFQRADDLCLRGGAYMR